MISLKINYLSSRENNTTFTVSKREKNDVTFIYWLLRGNEDELMTVTRRRAHDGVARFKGQTSWKLSVCRSRPTTFSVVRQWFNVQVSDQTSYTDIICNVLFTPNKKYFKNDPLILNRFFSAWSDKKLNCRTERLASCCYRCKESFFHVVVELSALVWNSWWSGSMMLTTGEK